MSQEGSSLSLYILAHFWETICFLIIIFAFFISLWELLHVTRPRPTLNRGCCDYYKRSLLQGALYEERANCTDGERDARCGTERTPTFQNRQGTHHTPTNKILPSSTFPLTRHRWRIAHRPMYFWPQEDLLILMFQQARINLMINTGTDVK
ncbi:unnamed protein product [Spodoptera littoralis]|uniref:Uncharacterized protein n=1 Tax=Spodoptera littoralis TaxID=7109 RepID=A0A9P0I7N7_SPOLI|nr:unnamed protein product [Spodoptera littoralis]